MGSFGFLGDDLGEVRVARGSKHDRVFATQELAGLPVLGAKLQAKFRGDRLVMVGSDWWPNLQPVQADPALTQASVLQALQADMAVGEAGNVGTTYLSDFGHEDLGMAWLPVRAAEEGQAVWNAHPVWQVEIQGRRGVIPVRYLTWVDMSTGTVVLRQNQVMHESGHGEEPRRAEWATCRGSPSRCFRCLVNSRPTCTQPTRTTTRRRWACPTWSFP